MELDEDIKIFGTDAPDHGALNDHNETALNAARALGSAVAAVFSKDAANFAFGDDGDYAMLMQRRLLLSFTATVSFERYCSDDTLVGVAQKAFLDYLKLHNPDAFRTCTDTGAFSFYYLAYRRGIEVDRRVGQTFAMLCSHDGDSVYQELGEALYCWFSGVVKEQAQQFGLICNNSLGCE